MRKTSFLLLLFCCLSFQAVLGQPMCSVTRYDETDGVSSAHITQLLQDEKGFLWFATWNGLCRYDGYEFRTFKSEVGDGCHMLTDRIRNIILLPKGRILCQVDEDYFLFDIKSCRFRDLTRQEKDSVGQYGRYVQSRSVQRKPYVWTDSHQTRWTLTNDGQLYYQDAVTRQQVRYPLPMSFHTLTFAMADRRGNLWALDYGSIYKFTTDLQRSHRLDIQPRAEVKCLFRDRHNRYWIATKDDQAIRLYSADDDRLLGYLGIDGRLHRQYTSFGASIYSICQSHDGTLWLGAKPGVIYRLRPVAADAFQITRLAQQFQSGVYHIAEDSWNRLWVATLGEGVFVMPQPQSDQPRLVLPKHYPQEASRARYLFINKGHVLLIATSTGLLVSRLQQDIDEMRFLLHQRQPDQAESLSCSATMDVAQDHAGRYYVSTESGGVNLIATPELLGEKLSFRHIREQFHVQPNDVVQSLSPLKDGGMMAVGSHLITLLDSTQQGRVLDVCNFDADYRFSEAHPLALPSDRCLFALTDGAFRVSQQELMRKAYCPPLVLTSLSVEGERGHWGVEQQDSLTLQPHERNITLHFAALDYQSAERIHYAFRLQPQDERDTTRWNYIGTDHSVTLLDMEPGTYQLCVRSTNADGEWVSNQRLLTIIVKPSFWEAWYGKLLLTLLAIVVAATVVWTVLYIRRIKRQQRETLEKYLNLQGVALTSSSPSPLTADLDPMLQRVMKFVEENIANSEAGVGDMAAAAATSRSGLQRKLRQAMGITPQDLLKEARIKHACQLLRQTDKNISEVAYACGFSDPKYFSRSFKQSMGVSPSDYRDPSS